MPPLEEQDQLINKEVRGFTWKQAAWFISFIVTSVVTIEATLLTGISDIKNTLKNHGADISMLKQISANTHNDLEAMKAHLAVNDVRIDNLRVPPVTLFK